MSRLPDDLVRQADEDLSGHLPNQFIRHLLDLASCGVPLDEVFKCAETTYLWYQAHARTALIPSRTNSSATSSSRFSSRSGTRAGVSSSRTSLSVDSGYERSVWPPIPEESLPTVHNTPSFHQGGHQVSRASKGFLSKLNTASDIPGPFRKSSCSGDSRCSGNSIKLYTCPWCQTGCTRQGELKKHFKQYCGSQNVYICGKCGTGAQTKKHADELLKCSSRCQPHNVQEYTLDYHRQAFACPGCGSIATSLEEHTKHFVDCCKDLGLTGPEQRSQQIRSLLSADHLRPRVENIWYKLGLVGKVESIDALLWKFENPSCAARTVERLEYGVRNVANGIPNFGIASARIDGVLADLISRGLSGEPDSVQPSSSAESSQSWISKQSLMTVPSATGGSGTSPLFDTMRCDSPKPLVSDHLVHNETEIVPKAYQPHPYSMSPQAMHLLGATDTRQSYPSHQIQLSTSTPKYSTAPAQSRTAPLPYSDPHAMEWNGHDLAFDAWPQEWRADADFIPGTPMTLVNNEAFISRDGMPF